MTFLNNYSGEKDKFTFGQIRDCLRIAKNNFSNLTEVTQFISIIAKLFVEISTTIYKTARNLINPIEVNKWRKVAIDALEQKIFEPKEIVIKYSKENKCDRIEDWEKNICNKPDDDGEQINF